MSFHDDLLEITTPENIAFGYPLAGIGSRFIAALVDTAIIVVLQVVVTLLGGLIAGMVMDQAASSQLLDTLSTWIIAVFGLIGFFFLWGYYIFFEMLWNGQSPGKRMAGLRVMRSNGLPISLSESVIRNLVRIIDFLPLFYGVGVVSMFVDSKARRLGDLAAGTLVVRETGSLAKLDALRPAASGEISPPFLEGYGELPLEELKDTDFDLIRNFLRRRDELTNSNAIEQQVFRRVFDRLGLPVPDLQAHQRIDLLRQIAAFRRVTAAGKVNEVKDGGF